MQTVLLPASETSRNRLTELHSDTNLADAAHLLWELLLKELKRRHPSTKKGPKSHSLMVTKADISNVRLASRPEFYWRAKSLDQVGKSGSILFWYVRAYCAAHCGI